MTSPAYLVAAVFLPLFPASMLFNRVFAVIGNTWLRMGLLVVWPQLGLLALAASGETPPVWLVNWAVLTACLYAFRALALRDLGLWTAHMATSAWALIWAVAMFGGDTTARVLQAVAFSVPFVLLTWLASRIKAACGAAYAGTCGGLAQTLPRLSTMLVLTLLAAIGTPLFPAFFSLLATVTRALTVAPGIALLILLAWLLWAWAGARMTHGMVVGPGSAEAGPDLGIAAALAPGILLVGLAVAGVTSLGYLV
jgi:NADH:ubiquinone oxidoreductase subunit 4 (subunit M)